jgi:hypothetical protein
VPESCDPMRELEDCAFGLLVGYLCDGLFYICHLELLNVASAT